MNYENTVGLEVHAELNTATKIYCGCKNAFGSEVNTNCCPICTGMPGTLPTLNEKVVEYAVKMGHALNCKINPVSKQDRKNYFYLDLPKAYQISQFDIPLCENGYLDVIMDEEGNTKRIGVTRIHIEEDAGKLLHDESFAGSLVDFNRCGGPLIEIVSEPDMHSSAEAKAYLETIKSILQYIDISDCKMQEGSIRCDINVSVRKPGDPLGTRCEMKNVNTFSGAVRAIEYEANRQIGVLEAGGVIHQETRRWDDAKGMNFLLRSKEDSHDYRYFPEPDLLTIVVEEEIADELVAELVRLCKAQKIGPAYDKTSNLGPVGSKSHQKFVLDWIEKGIEEGAELVLDGRNVKVEGYEDGYYIGHTIFDHVTEDMTIGTREVFGPVLCIKRVKSFEEGLALMNRNPYANGSVIFTQNGHYAREFMKNTDGGMVGVNVGIPVPIGIFPFCGHKQSFFGDLHCHGKDAFRFYTESKCVTTRWFDEEEKKKANVDTWDGSAL